MKKILIAAMAVLAFSACGNKNGNAAKDTDSTDVAVQDTTNAETLVGEWTMPDPIDSTKTMGVKLNADSTAESINMATLPYSKWTSIEDGKAIIIYGKSKGNGEEFDIADTASVANDNGTMTLNVHGQVYTKK